MIEGRRKAGPQINPSTSKAIREAIADVHNGELVRALRVFKSYYVHRTERLPPEGLSYFGFCLASVNGLYREGIALCRESIQTHPYYGQSYVNLARIYLLAGNRRKAVDAIDEGLVNNPNHSGIIAFQMEIGYRKRSPIPFLPRDHSLNVKLGRKRRQKSP